MTIKALGQRLLEAGWFQCPQCGSKSLTGSLDQIACGSCQASFEIRNGTIDFFANYTSKPQRRFGRSEPFVKAVAAQWGLDESEASLERVAGILDYTLLVTEGSRELTAEIQEFACRLNLEPPQQALMARKEFAASVPTKDANVDVSLGVVRHYIDGYLPAGSQVYRSFRIRNSGGSVVSSDGDQPVLLSYHWFDAAGNLVEFEGLRSAFPRDIAPGEEVTVITAIRTPEREGHFILHLCAVQEGVRWIDQPLQRLPVECGKVRCSPAIVVDPAPIAFEEDQARGRNLVRSALAGRQYGSSRPLVLEVCAGVFPQVAPLCEEGIDVVCSDISFAMTQFGRVIHERLGPDYQNATCFMAADAESACFADDMFDGVVMFAALHHFPDPVAILRALARKTKAGGFLGVLREPCEPNPWDVAYLRDIRNGINEQMFSIEEYNEIFRRAGVRPESMRVDGGHSLKAILTRY